MQTIATDVLIIGAGAAGIRAALAASEAGVEIVMVAKGEVTLSGSTFSPISRGWGIKAPLGEERAEKNLETSYDDIVWVGWEPQKPAAGVQGSFQRLSWVSLWT
jgi:fumarate reductase (CoM/CoB) subunit A